VRNEGMKRSSSRSSSLLTRYSHILSPSVSRYSFILFRLPLHLFLSIQSIQTNLFLTPSPRSAHSSFAGDSEAFCCLLWLSLLSDPSDFNLNITFM
jgi:hypothetical protein